MDLYLVQFMYILITRIRTQPHIHKGNNV